MDLPSMIGLVASGVAIAKDMGTTAKDVSGIFKHVKTKNGSDTTELQKALEDVDAQTKLIGMVQQALEVQLAFVDIRDALQAGAQREQALLSEIDAMKGFDANIIHYELISGPQAGMFAMTKRDATGPERDIRLCHSCFSRRQIAYYHYLEPQWNTDVLKCEACSATFHVSNGDTSAVVSFQSSSRFDEF